ncbi:hypothetical protein [Luteibacter sp. E-22]|uniref:hypothetical protein n=1 Tax=Luteibacter sp. E-22 TaxID=3404050 RepID=UPI003CF9296B
MIGKMKALALTATALCGFVSMSASADWLKAGQSLGVNQSLTSHDGRYTAIMQGDGNFVVYRLADGAAIWNTETSGSGAVAAFMQSDGNFVLYRADGSPVWWTGTVANAGLANEFTVDDSGMAVVVAYAPVWATNTVTPGGAPQAAPLVFQYGFHFERGVVYNGPNGNQWTFQTDGNLVLYHNGRPVWASNVTQAHGGPAIYSVFDGGLTTWNDSGYVWQGASNWSYPAGFTYESGVGKTLNLHGDSTLLNIQDDGNAVIWVAARKWGAPANDPPASTLPPASGPHCIGDPTAPACTGSGKEHDWEFPW